MMAVKRKKTYEANRGLSWFSMKEPSRVESAHFDFTVLIMS